MRKLEAEITIEYDDARVAESIAHAVSPDNSIAPNGLSIETRSERNKVVTVITCDRGFKTFIATIDDILYSLATAEKTLQGTMKLQA